MTERLCWRRMEVCPGSDGKLHQSLLGTFRRGSREDGARRHVEQRVSNHQAKCFDLLEIAPDEDSTQVYALTTTIANLQPLGVAYGCH